MSQEQEISVQIDTLHGQIQSVKVETSGFVGRACTAATSGVEAAFGVVDRKWKPEADAPAVVASTNQGTHLRL
jgi:hypothetical protein